MDANNLSGVSTLLLLLSIAFGLLVLIGIGLFAYRYNRIKSSGQVLSDAEMLRRAELAWARDPANPANAAGPAATSERDELPPGF